MLFKTIDEMTVDLAKRVKMQRKVKKITQEKFALKCNIPYGTYKKFEQTGEISLKGLTKIAVALGMEDEIENLFTRKTFGSIEEVIQDYEEYEKTRGLY